MVHTLPRSVNPAVRLTLGGTLQNVSSSAAVTDIVTVRTQGNYCGLLATDESGRAWKSRSVQSVHSIRR